MVILQLRLINSIFLFSSELFVGRHENISILFADICKFTELTTTLSVDKLVETLNDLFGKFDDAADVSISQYTEWFVKKLHSNILHYVRWCYTLNFCKGNGKLIFQYSNNRGPTLLLQNYIPLYLTNNTLRLMVQFPVNSDKWTHGWALFGKKLVHYSYQKAITKLPE